MVLYRADGRQMSAEDWQDPTMRTLAVALDGRQIAGTDGGTTGDRFLLLLERAPRAGQVFYPARPGQLGRRPHHRRAR